MGKLFCGFRTIFMTKSFEIWPIRLVWFPRVLSRAPLQPKTQTQIKHPKVCLILDGIVPCVFWYAEPVFDGHHFPRPRGSQSCCPSHRPQRPLPLGWPCSQLLPWPGIHSVLRYVAIEQNICEMHVNMMWGNLDIMWTLCDIEVERKWHTCGHIICTLFQPSHSASPFLVV